MPFSLDPDGPGPRPPIQIGIPDVLPEEAPLTSEVVLDGGVLSQRRKDAFAQLRSLLVDRPAEIDPEDWRVIVAELAPPDGHLGRVAGGPAARLGRMQRARDCFPGLSAPAALKRYREALTRPAVVEFVADVRALEIADVVEQRAMVREVLRRVLDGVDMLDAPALKAAPGEWAKVAAVVTGAAKVLVDMDGLKMPAGAADAASTPKTSEPEEDPGTLARALVSRVAEDLRARREAAGAGGAAEPAGP